MEGIVGSEEQELSDVGGGSRFVENPAPFETAQRMQGVASLILFRNGSDAVSGSVSDAGSGTVSDAGSGTGSDAGSGAGHSVGRKSKVKGYAQRRCLIAVGLSGAGSCFDENQSRSRRFFTLRR